MPVSRVLLLLVAFAVVLLPWGLWRLRAVRLIAPLAVLQILVGVALGPSLLGRLAPDVHRTLFTPAMVAALDGIANIGVLLYVFVTGLHLDLAPLRAGAGRLGAAALGSVCVPLVFGAAAGWWMLRLVPEAAGSEVCFVASVAICIAVTALPVLAAILQELGLIATRLGQTALALAAANDGALWIMLAILLALSGSGGAGLTGLAGAVAWFAFLGLVVRPLLSRLIGSNAQSTLVLGATLAIVSAGISEALGTGYLIGAFGAGLVAPPGWRTWLIERLEPVTLLILLPFFFMSTGLKALIEPDSTVFLALLAVIVAATVFGKLAGTALPARRLGFSWSDCLALGAMMQTKGLMEVVVLRVLDDAGLIGRQLFSAMVAMAIICTVLTGPAIRLSHALERGREPHARPTGQPG